MNKVWIVQGEHPFDPYYPHEVYGSFASAERRCVELTAEMLKAYWASKNDDAPLLQPPEVTIFNWEQIVEEYGDDDEFVQDDGWGRWDIEMTEKEVRP